ncbi:MAG: mandelate racemase/muconate lactonizing enzyme family protein [Armatimonadota bacterium]|nr:mandelate racemase/muconate lactonizing enzyme family protein [Armatimonadota bacterium]
MIPAAMLPRAAGTGLAMRVTGVECIVLRLPEVRLIADGTQDTLLVRVHTDAGIVGVGEAHTAPWVLKAIIEAPPSHIYAQGLRDLLIGEDPFDRERIWDKLYRYSTVYGRRGAVIHAISALDLALWDLVGKAEGKPVWQLLGERRRSRVPAYASTLMPEDAAEAAEETLRWHAEGFRAVKLGWGSLGQDVARDLAMVAAVRERVGADVDLLIDVGYGMDVESAIRLARGLEALDAFLLEEPLSPDDLDGYARLADAVALPIAAGEKETTRFGFQDLIERGRVDIVQPDLARAGGFTECRRIAGLAAARGVTVLPHCWSTDILVAATLHFVSVLPECPYLEYCVLETPLRRELVREPIRARGGFVEVPEGPGLGVEVNEETVARFRYA